MFNKDLTTEQWLHQWVGNSDQYKTKEIRVDEIDFKKSQSVQNRSAVKIDEDHAAHIMLWLEDPTHSVTPIVVNRVGQKYHIIDGNHRAYAHHIAGRETIPAYVLSVPQETYEGMVLAANARNAKALTPKERVQLAMQAAERFGTTVAADQFQIKPEEINRAVRAHTGRAKFEQATRQDGEKLTERKAELINRLDEDQIERIGADNLLQATVNEVEQTVRNISAAPAVQRHEQAIREAGRLAQARQDKKTPVGRAKRKVSAAIIRTKINEAVKYLAENPAALNDDAMVRALDELVKVVQQHGVSGKHAA